MIPQYRLAGFAKHRHNTRMTDSPRLVSPVVPLTTLIVCTLVFIWSGIEPHDRFTWWLEVAPVLLALPVLALSYKRFRLTDLLYVLIGIHAIILMVGGHYTYALVPLFDTIRDWLGQDRNSYDGVGHLAQGFIPALVARELLIRTSGLERGKWMVTVILLSCLGISAIYEVIERIAGATSGESAEAFLGTQGDPWDTQKDMALAGVGAALGLLTLSKLHDRFLRKIGQ